MVFEMIMLLAAAVDQAFKGWIESQEQSDFPRPMKQCGGRIHLYRDHNFGFPFGFLKEKQELVQMFPLVLTSMLGGVYLYLKKCRKEPFVRLMLALSIGGSLSNLYDRRVRGYVVDYFSIQFGWLKRVVFNLGDLFVIFGSTALAMKELMEEFHFQNKAK